MARLLFVLGILMLAGCDSSERMRAVPTSPSATSDAPTPPDSEAASPQSIDMH